MHQDRNTVRLRQFIDLLHFRRIALYAKLTLTNYRGPCRAEHPELNTLYQQYKDRGLEIVGVSIDEDRDKWVKAVAKDQLKWPQLSDLKHPSEIGDYYGLIGTGEAIPFNILINKEGEIVDKKLSLKDLEAIFQGLP